MTEDTEFQKWAEEFHIGQVSQIPTCEHVDQDGPCQLPAIGLNSVHVHHKVWFRKWTCIHHKDKGDDFLDIKETNWWEDHQEWLKQK